MENMRSSIVAFCRTSPLTRVWIRRDFGSLCAGTAIGPYVNLEICFHNFA
jgi:hypothetical protein